ncbi:MAG: Lrp/AsnC ligand binding domain-containing protein [Chloroflexi bacterium]|nr:Lrp/AsnC ligand binding domain-containing protein [Chloroflexota bacterium]
MSPKAFILIETGVGKTRSVSKALANLNGIASVDAVTGPYDIVAVVTAPDLNSVGELVTNNVHTIDGIVRTVTCLSVSDTS